MKHETSLKLSRRLGREQIATAIRDEKRRKSRRAESALERFQRLQADANGTPLFPGQIQATRRIRASMQNGRDWLSLRPRGAR